ncbi:patatin-like phospholipase family protein [Candidatus Gottesmanbacteria bacterium]|nr:patatin-like phospholipase family protein [Candidatus Gottesmanbacteria bacterium]
MKSHKPAKKIGLALGSGGPRGLAHIGVIKALLEHRIPIDIIAGASAGSLIGGMFLALGSIQKVEDIAKTLSYKDIISAFADFGSRSGIIKGVKMEQHLGRLLGRKKIENLPIPYAAVATDMTSGDTVTITRGNLVKAIRASSSIPALVDAAYFGKTYLIDGGGSNPVPVSVARDLGADYVIAVNLDVYEFINANGFPGKKPNVTDMGLAALHMLRYNLAKKLCEDADVTITPPVASVSSINLTEFLHGESIIQKGYTATIAALPRIRQVLSVAGIRLI